MSPHAECPIALWHKAGKELPLELADRITALLKPVRPLILLDMNIDLVTMPSFG